MAARDLVGYGSHPPHPRWPGDARVVVQFVLNIEEGAESCLLNGDAQSEAWLRSDRDDQEHNDVLNGDAQSEAWLHELPGRPPRTGERDLSVEGMYEYATNGLRVAPAGLLRRVSPTGC